MKIIAKNGVDGFKTIEECLEYEDALDSAQREAEAKAEELKKTQKERYAKIEKLYEEVMSNIKSYEKDYGVIIKVPGHGYDFSWRW